MKFDYFEYMKAVSVADLTGPQKSVAGAYARSYNPDRQDGLHEESSKGIFRIAEETGYDDNTVSKARKHLLAKGWITSQRRMGMSSLTACEIPAGFDYEAMKLAQDERVASSNDSNNKRVRGQRKVKEASVSPSKETVVSEEPVVILSRETAIVGQEEAIVEHVETVAEEISAGVVEEINPLDVDDFADYGKPDDVEDLDPKFERIAAKKLFDDVTWKAREPEDLRVMWANLLTAPEPVKAPTISGGIFDEEW